MSITLSGQGGLGKNRKPTSSSWNQILELGRKLQSLNQISESKTTLFPAYVPGLDSDLLLSQREVIITTADQLIAGQSELWLPHWLGLELGCLSHLPVDSGEAHTSQEDLFSEKPTDRTARRAVSSQHICTSQADKPAAVLSAPLLNPNIHDQAGPVLGALTIRRPHGPVFNRLERELIEGLAIQAANAVQTVRSRALDRRRIMQLSTISEVSKAISSILDEEELLQQVVDLIQARFNFPYVHLFSVHPGRRLIFFESGSGSRSTVLAEMQLSYDIDENWGLIPWVARHSETVLVNDVTRDERYRPSDFFPPDTRAELTIPVIYGTHTLGVLDIQSDQENAFDRDDLLLCEALADSIAIAMRNASLYRSERWRRQVADSIQEVAGLVSAEVGIDQVLQATLLELVRNLPCDLAAVWFLEVEQTETHSEKTLPVLRLASLYGPDVDSLEMPIGLDLEEILEYSRSLSGETNDESGAIDSRPEWLFEALDSDIPVIRAADTQLDTFGRALGLPENYSAIAAALRVGSNQFGLLTLVNRTPGRYGGEARNMTAAFASYASVAIQNTRLYESAHEQVWVSTVLLQVAEATESIEDLNELLATVVNITPMLVGVKACAVYLVNPDGLFFPAAASGLPPETQTEFETSRFSANEIPALKHLWNEHQPTILNRQGEDQRLAGLFPAKSPREETFDLLILVPLLSHSEILGAMLVQYNSDPSKNMLQALETFFDERLAIIQGIAHQAATAVENIRLIKSQEEEAYVSIALLQVAQAIVSSSDLHETLGAIVRITPLLTGVKRVVIYLFDHRTSQLRLAQAYGMPRDANTYPYNLDEFPLLEAALQWDALTAYPLNPVAEDEWEDVPDAWTYLPASDLEEIHEYLTSDERLLIVLPLTVKGAILGAMLIEEPDQIPYQDQVSVLSNLRLRPKRLEIATGISQQTALAIQNDLLQRETLERERFEREMQFAREIQRAFLPVQMPNFPGYEIEVWWRTAREMGGDFYDFIELGPGRLGLVIADVADKGMPAAMFMILTRALLRASAHEDCSPAEVLNQVNNLLLPDAHAGMFVTLFYAVFDYQTGQLTYSNAGHNPAFWARRQSGTIEMLSRSGMALGVMENSAFEERTIELAQGDMLVLYTDGVTEAFSPEGLFFGNERLIETIQAAVFSETNQNLSALSMLKTLEQTLEAFTNSSPPADDSTVLILFHNPDQS